MMRNKEKEKFLKDTAHKIAELEKEMQLGKNVKKNEHKIENIMCSLSLEELLLIDDYILESLTTE